MTTPDEALIAQLQDAHGRATKGVPGWFGACQGMAMTNLPRLIELAREAILSRAVCEAARRYMHRPHNEDCDYLDLMISKPCNCGVADVTAALSTLASATRKETA